MRQIGKVVAAALCALQLSACAGMLVVEHDVSMNVTADRGSSGLAWVGTKAFDAAKGVLCPHGAYAESRHASVQTWTERENPWTHRVQPKARINAQARARC